jgi:hypothetical protein
MKGSSTTSNGGCDLERAVLIPGAQSWLAAVVPAGPVPRDRRRLTGTREIDRAASVHGDEPRKRPAGVVHLREEVGRDVENGIGQLPPLGPESRTTVRSSSAEGVPFLT